MIRRSHVTFILLAFLVAAALASLRAAEPEQVFAAGALRWPDYLLIVVYLALVVGLGAWVGRGQQSTEDFFLAGRRMHWFPAGISIMATLFSAISYLGYPGEIYRYGAPYTAVMVSFVLVSPFILWYFMPFYSRLRVTTAYEYLEHRFDVRVRAAASALFILCRLGWMAAVVYTPSLALHVVTGLPLLWIIVVCGVLATLYTVLGGMEAVIWTDVAQFFVLVGGLLGALLVVHLDLDGGVGEALRMARQADLLSAASHRLRWIWDTSFAARVTVWGCWIGTLVTFLSDYGVDQVTIQRYLTTPDLRQMRRSFLINMAGVFIVLGGLMLVGTGLWAYFQQHIDPVVTRLEGADGFDKVFPYFIASRFPVGFSGLMIAALLAATMSSIDSGLNSTVTALTVDFCERFGWVGSDESERLCLARWLTLQVGILVTGLALLVGNLGNIIEITNKVNSGFKGPLLAIFLLGLLTRKARGGGVLIGAAVGLGIALYATYWWPEATRPNFLWLSLIGFVPAMVVGYLASLVGPAETMPREHPA